MTGPCQGATGHVGPWRRVLAVERMRREHGDVVGDPAEQVGAAVAAAPAGVDEGAERPLRGLQQRHDVELRLGLVLQRRRGPSLGDPDGVGRRRIPHQAEDPRGLVGIDPVHPRHLPVDPRHPSGSRGTLQALTRQLDACVQGADVDRGGADRQRRERQAVGVLLVERSRMPGRVHQTIHRDDSGVRHEHRLGGDRDAAGGGHRRHVPVVEHLQLRPLDEAPGHHAVAQGRHQRMGAVEDPRRVPPPAGDAVPTFHALGRAGLLQDCGR